MRAALPGPRTNSGSSGAVPGGLDIRYRLQPHLTGHALPTETSTRSLAVTDFFSPWCDPATDELVGKHTSRVLVSNDDAVGINAVVALMPGAYAEKENLKRIAKRHGKKGVAKLLSSKVPKTKTGRSGDMGEILGAVYVQSTMGYTTGPSRLIERDHQEWAMRGDDVLGARLNGQKLELVKVEAKSRIKAMKADVTEAREGLLRNGDLASSHSLTQFAERLLKADETLSDAVNDLLQNDGLRPGQFAHVMFIFAGNHPITHIRDDLNAYMGKVAQTTVTVRVGAHQDFIRESYDTAVTNAP